MKSLNHFCEWESIFSNDQSRILTVGDNKITIWDIATGKSLYVLKTAKRATSVVWDSDNNIVTAVWSDEPSQPTETSLIWRWNLSPEAIANGTVGIMPDPSAVDAAPVSLTGTTTGNEASNDTCQIKSNTTINKRGGPGTSYKIVGQMQPGETTEATGQQTVASYVWWKLVDNSWVRSDLVSANEVCANLPQGG